MMAWACQIKTGAYQKSSCNDLMIWRRCTCFDSTFKTLLFSPLAKKDPHTVRLVLLLQQKKKPRKGEVSIKNTLRTECTLVTILIPKKCSENIQVFYWIFKRKMTTFLFRKWKWNSLVFISPVCMNQEFIEQTLLALISAFFQSFWKRLVDWAERSLQLLGRLIVTSLGNDAHSLSMWAPHHSC